MAFSMTDAASTSSPSPATPAMVLARRERALGHITLDRPEALNALARGMKRAVADALTRWDRDPEIYALVLDSTSPRAFSVGGDLREFVGNPASRAEILALQAEETRLLWQMECCIKPVASLIDGLVMGFAAGLSTFGTHRVAGAGYAFAMPETAIGYFPDAGATHFLGRMPDHVGLYLGLTGARLGRADAYALGLVTHCIDARHFDAIREGLAEADPIDALLDGRHAPPGDGPLALLRPAIARCFAQESVEAIIAALEQEARDTRSDAVASWARETRAILSQRSPSSLKLTLRQLRGAARGDLKTALETEYRMAAHRLAHPDFQEGIRVTLLDKGAAPLWTPPTLAEVTPAMLDAAFAPLDPSTGASDLVLPPRPASLVALG